VRVCICIWTSACPSCGPASGLAPLTHHDHAHQDSRECVCMHVNAWEDHTAGRPFAYTCTHTQRRPPPTHTHTHARAHAHTHTCTCTPACMLACTHTRTHLKTRVHQHTHTHTHTHTHKREIHLGGQTEGGKIKCSFAIPSKSCCLCIQLCMYIVCVCVRVCVRVCVCECVWCVYINVSK